MRDQEASAERDFIVWADLHICLPRLSPLDFALEIQPQGKLNQPGIVQCLIDYAKT
jgi:hypothetical protein